MIRNNKPPESFWDMNDEFVFFLKGHLSQWWNSTFYFNNVMFNSAEQFMMYQKARIFGDTRIIEKLLATDNPREQKDLGKQVSGFKKEIWDIFKYEAVYMGNYLKFSQNDDLRKVLFLTGDRELVEVNPVDTVWAIAMAIDDLDRFDRKKWKGENLLGIALTNVRNDFRSVSAFTEPY